MKEFIRFGKYRIEYLIKRTKRKRTVAISITPASQVIVLAPKSLRKREIKEIILKKALWIIDKKEYFKKIATLYPEREYVSGEQVLILGRRYRLKVIQSRDNYSDIPHLSGRKIEVYISENLKEDEKKDTIKNILFNWYQQKAQRVVTQRIKMYSKLLNVKVKEVIVKAHKKRWGSCSNNGVLRFNWKIVMAPISVLDYVVIHELCHLKIKNHSKEFWKSLSLFIPDYKEKKNWLKQNIGMFRF